MEILTTTVYHIVVDCIDSQQKDKARYCNKSNPGEARDKALRNALAHLEAPNDGT